MCLLVRLGKDTNHPNSQFSRCLSREGTSNQKIRLTLKTATVLGVEVVVSAPDESAWGGEAPSYWQQFTKVLENLGARTV